jgi:Na+:H+ antiporter, NhaA family
MTGERPTLVDPIDAQRDRLRGGEPNDAITLVEYGDYECPYSRAAYRSIQGIERELGERLCFVFRHFPLREIHPHAQLAAEAAEEAAAHDRFWAVHDLLFGHQRSLEKPDLRRYAADAGLDLTEFDAALADGRHQARIGEDLASGLRSGVEGTPTLFIDGVRYERSYMPDELASALRRSSPTGNP